MLLSTAARPLKCLMVLLVLTAAAVSLLARDHYTVDVLLALYIAGGVGLLRRGSIEAALAP